MTNDLRWKVLSERTVVKDQWIDLRAQRCLTPRGAVLDPFYLLALPDFVHVVALTEEGDVVLVREYRHAIGACVLNLPGGWIDAGEHPLAAAKRELAEEAGFVCEDWREVAQFGADIGRQDNSIHVFLALAAKPGAVRNLDAGEEGMTVELLSPEHLYEGLATGLLPHAAHISAFLLAMKAAGWISRRFSPPT